MVENRWIQRFDNYKKALIQLSEAVELMKLRQLSRLEKQGTIHAFEYTHELGWKVMKDFLEIKGNSELYGSRDVTRLAFQMGLIRDGQIWMEMIKSRNLSSHTYDESTADEIIELIVNVYYPEFCWMMEKMKSLEMET